MDRGNRRSRLVTKTTTVILATAQDITNQAFPAVEVDGLSRRARGRRSRGLEGRFDNGPTTAHPVAVAAIDKFVRASSEATLGSVLTCGQPRDQPG